ncbi:beta-phosphoglucomutase [Enterococcus sp. DIV0086]|uniref:beta-phosphoglucomutase n=1 Tax=Enterococcus sp. DIV0086 TaxID=2774655 RepID=UPI003D2A5DD6
MMYEGAIFDLDGVLVDTAKYHFLAWKSLADRLGINFTEQDNERLKGVSRMASLDILLSLGNRTYIEDQKAQMAAEKNDLYVSFIEKMNHSEILPGVVAFLTALKARKIKTSLGSASKNSSIILQNTGLMQYFDAIVDGNDVTKAKPDPEVFLLGAKRLGLTPVKCVVFEDAQAGCEAGKAAKMYVVGIGKAKNLPSADMVIPDFKHLKAEQLF